jgi:phage terminase small subunit
MGHELLKHPEILAEIERQKDIACVRNNITVDYILSKWKAIADADPNELISLRLECCRHCYGNEHLYQWTKIGYKLALERSRRHVCNPRRCSSPCPDREPPDPMGGFDFDPTKPPLKECPACMGEGFVRVMLKDTTRCSWQALQLYRGVKQTQHGIEILMADKDGAIKSMAEFKGMMVRKAELTLPPGESLPVSVTAKDFTLDQLASMYAQIQERKKANGEPAAALPVDKKARKRVKS